ncbi:MAG: hypothetical protein M1818_007076 [Claussenomyces sp. TS43310]|nr:MAG: hypothetical protein M1818_007076 [Claussenomyces sp. TS43310]
MPSSKGKETDPELKKKVTEEVKQQPNKDGGGKGQMAAWKVPKQHLSYLPCHIYARKKKSHLFITHNPIPNTYSTYPRKSLTRCPPLNTQASKVAKEYEKQGGDYEDEAGSKNKPEKGPPQHKSPASSKAAAAAAAGDKDKDGAAAPKKAKAAKSKKEEPAQGSRTSARQAAQAKKRKDSDDQAPEKPAGKKAKVGTQNGKKSK